MTSVVHFLPWSERARYPAWIARIGAFDAMRPRDFVAVKIHFGEEGNDGYIRPEYVRPIAEGIARGGSYPFVTDANTIYVGQRADAYHHHIVAEKHGFSLAGCGCPVIIADGLRGNSGVNVEINKKHFASVHIANAIHYADSHVFMNHFKGHEISGFGGALKNMGMGCGTRAGKYAMHDTLKPAVDTSLCVGCGHCVTWCGAAALTLQGKTIAFSSDACVGCGECILSCPRGVFSIPWDETTGSVQEKIVEYAYGVVRGKRHYSINFLNHITQYCDCYPNKGAPLIEDIGIVAGADPVAVDQASADLVNKRYGGDFWRHMFPEIDWTVQLSYAEQLGIGQRAYSLVEG